MRGVGDGSKTNRAWPPTLGFAMVRKMKGKVRTVNPTVIRWDALESGTKIYYRDNTFTNILRRLPK